MPSSHSPSGVIFHAANAAVVSVPILKLWPEHGEASMPADLSSWLVK